MTFMYNETFERFPLLALERGISYRPPLNFSNFDYSPPPLPSGGREGTMSCLLH